MRIHRGAKRFGSLKTRGGGSASRRGAIALMLVRNLGREGALSQPARGNWRFPRERFSVDLLRENGMKHRLTAALLIAIAPSLHVAAAPAAECAAQIVELEQPLERQPDLVGTAPQTIDAQLEHQPTPSSVAQAQVRAKSDLARTLEQAKALDEQGRERECVAVLAKARILLNP
jgi:hypothetical protein